MKALSVGLCAAALLLSGCAHGLYRWGNYDDKLYSYYRHPEQSDKYMDGLVRIITDCNKHSSRVPPGICAEYGYCLYEKKQHTLAVQFFELEKTTYPESAFLMDKMIANVKSLSEGSQ